MTSLTKKQKSKTFTFFKIKTTRLPASLKGLNSSLAQSAAELCLNKACPKWANIPLVLFWNLSKMLVS